MLLGDEENEIKQNEAQNTQNAQSGYVTNAQKRK